MTSRDAKRLRAAALAAVNSFFDALEAQEREAPRRTVVRAPATAGIPPVAAPDLKGEVPATYVGELRFAGGRVVRFERAWVYWIASFDESVPMPDAHAINERPGDFGETKYSGAPGTLGAVALPGTEASAYRIDHDCESEEMA